MFQIYDYFYKAQGFAHVMVHLTEAVKREYAAELRDRLTVLELLGQVSHSLGRAASLKPVFVLDGGRLAQAGLRARRGAGRPLRQPPPQPRRLHRRRAPAHVLDPGGAREVGRGV